jgi:hypothetical protein
MPRKQKDTVQAHRDDIVKKYKRGPKAEKRVRGEDALTETDKLVKRDVACYLKAMDFSYGYIAESLGVTKDVLKKWFTNDELGMQDRVAEIRESYTAGAIKLMKTYAIELVEMVMEIARTTEDEALVLKIATEMWDRMGIAKVNKSESVSAQTIREEREIDITDKSGMVEALRHAPPEVQARAAEAMEELMSLATEHNLDFERPKVPSDA